MMYKIACASDLHEFLPKIPDGIDLLLLAGDYVFTRKGDCRAQLKFLNGKFHQWISELSERMDIILVAGNHDEAFEHYRGYIDDFPPNVYYLEDRGMEWNGLKVWGSPQTLFFYDWAFNQRPTDIKKFWDAIPSDTDILITHQPPYYFGDLVPRMNPKEDESIFDGEHVGCPALLNRILEVKPKLVVCGHIHGGYGKYATDGITLVNAAYVNDDYKPANEIIVVEIEN